MCNRNTLSCLRPIFRQTLCIYKLRMIVNAHIIFASLYPLHNEVVGVERGGGGGILVSLRPSAVCPSSIRPSVRPSVRPANRVHFVASTVLVGSILYSYILSSNFRRCVACKVFLQNFQINIFGICLKFVTLTLCCFDLGSDVNH